MKSYRIKNNEKLAQLRVAFPGSLVLFDMDEYQRVQGLIVKFGLSEADASTLLQDIADMVVTFNQDVSAILQDLEEVPAT